MFRDVLDNLAGEHRLPAEPGHGERTKVIKTSVEEPLDGRNRLETHAPDGEVLIAVSASKIAVFSWQDYQMKAVIAESSNQLIPEVIFWCFQLHFTEFFQGTPPFLAQFCCGDIANRGGSLIDRGDCRATSQQATVA
jgi:hypothetical protein